MKNEPRAMRLAYCGIVCNAIRVRALNRASLELKTKGGGPLPQNPLPPSPDQSDHSGKKRNLQQGKSGQAIFGTPSFGSKTPSPPPPPPLLKRSPGPQRQFSSGYCILSQRKAPMALSLESLLF